MLSRVIDQDRIIHELYTGKHGVIPHPSEVYQAGLWEIYKPDEHQGHAEHVGDVGELADLRAANDTLTRQLEAARGEVERLKKQVKRQKRKADLDDGFIDFLTTKDG
ncbi:MAG: hypothetical protein LCI00_16765 [Chloroflexi bacterium]|nr:hypothetical protein [Chloroflexota bacterium]